MVKSPINKSSNKTVRVKAAVYRLKTKNGGSKLVTRHSTIRRNPKHN